MTLEELNNVVLKKKAIEQTIKILQTENIDIGCYQVNQKQTYLVCKIDEYMKEALIKRNEILLESLNTILEEHKITV